MPGDPAPSPAPSEAAAATKPAPSSNFPLPKTNLTEPTRPELLKPAVAGEIPSWPPKEAASAERNLKQEATPTIPSSDGRKPAFQIPDPPPPAPGVALNPQAFTPPADKLLPAGVKSDGTSPLEARPPAGADPKRFGLGEEHKTPGTAGATSGPGSPATVMPSPTANAVTSWPLETASRPNAGSIPPLVSGSMGLSQDPVARPGSDRDLPHLNSPSVGQDKSSLKDTASMLAATPSPTAVGSTEKSVPLGPLAAGPSQPNSFTPTPAPSASGPSSVGNIPSRSRPPLGAPSPAASPSISVLAPPAAPLSLNPQVESYDEDTYTCKAKDTFGTISQAVYHTDQYGQALQLFNRNHPLAGAALRQDLPVLQAGQPVYIPPVRILEKYYGAPVLESPPHLPSPPPARTTDRSDAAGSVQPPSISLVGFGTPVKSALLRTAVPFIGCMMAGR